MFIPNGRVIAMIWLNVFHGYSNMFYKLDNGEWIEQALETGEWMPVYEESVADELERMFRNPISEPKR